MMSGDQELLGDTVVFVGYAQRVKFRTLPYDVSEAGHENIAS